VNSRDTIACSDAISIKYFMWALPGNVRSVHGYELAIQWRFRI